MKLVTILQEYTRTMRDARENSEKLVSKHHRILIAKTKIKIKLMIKEVFIVHYIDLIL